VNTNESNKQMGELIARIAQLPSQGLEPQQFFSDFLQLSIGASGAHGGAVWLIQQDQAPQCYCHMALETTGIQEDEAQNTLITEALQSTITENRVVVVNGKGDGSSTVNNCEWPFFFRPIRAANQVAMILHLIGPAFNTQDDAQFVVNLLDKMCESPETYLAQRRALVLEDDRKSLAQLLKASHGMHDSLDPTKVIYQMVNLGRDVLGCERVMVWIKPEVKKGLMAVSGIDKPDPRSVLLQSVTAVCEYCLIQNKVVIGSRDGLVEIDESDPSAPLLKTYFHNSQLNEAYFQPIVNNEQVIGVICAEGFEEAQSEAIGGLLTNLATDGGAAIGNALAYDGASGIRSFSKMKNDIAVWTNLKKWLIGIAAVFLLGLLIQWPVKISSQCEIMPRLIRQVQSPLDNVEVVNIVNGVGVVAKNDILLQLDDLKLQTELKDLLVQREQQALAFEQETSQTKRNEIQLQRKITNNNIDYIRIQIEKANVKAPIDGTILTPHSQIKALVRKKMQLGTVICEISDLTKWDLVVSVPQEDIQWVKDKLVKDKHVAINFFLSSFEEHTLKTTLSDFGEISEMAIVKDAQAGNVFDIRIALTPESIAQIENELRPGTTGKAKIITEPMPLLYVLLRKVIRFVRVTIIF